MKAMRSLYTADKGPWKKLQINLQSSELKQKYLLLSYSWIQILVNIVQTLIWPHA